MSFLELHSRQVRVKDLDINENEIGDRDRSYSGAARLTRRAQKRTWSGSGPVMTKANADILRNLLLTTGYHGWPFTVDSNGNGVRSYTSKGAAPSSDPATSVPYVLSADGLLVYLAKDDGSQFLWSRHPGALITRSAQLNECTANQSSVETNTTGFTAVDAATLARVTTAKWTGTASLQVTTNASGATRGGVYAAVTAASTTTYAGSVYLRAVSGSPVVRVRLRNETAGNEVSVTAVTLSSTYWTRVRVNNRTGVTAGNSLRLYVEEETVDSAVDIYCDGFQVEPSVWATPWVLGGTSTAGSEIVFASSPLIGTLTDFCWAGWIGQGSAPVTDERDVFRMGPASASTDLFALFWNINTSTLRVQFNGSAGTGTNVTMAAGMHHVMISYTAATGALIVYVDGVSAATATIGATSRPNFANAAVINLGRNVGNVFNGYLGDVVIMPWAPSTTELDRLYALISGTTGLVPLHLATFPYLWLDGDVLGTESPVKVLPRIDGAKNVGFGSVASWNNNGRVSSFTLEEA